ncbi:MAG: hypothetical protein CBD18_09005 [Opitutales bacterium TMED158]|nr:MAG: hypothetical protein CBD18_09005 [Opitutales bacterium TMED158]
MCVLGAWCKDATDHRRMAQPPVNVGSPELSRVKLRVWKIQWEAISVLIRAAFYGFPLPAFKAAT